MAQFRRLRTAIGLKGKPTATTPGEEFKTFAESVIERLGPYPHARLNAEFKAPKQSTRLLKRICQSCGYTVRVTSKWLVAGGAPICQCSGEAMTISDNPERPAPPQPITNADPPPHSDPDQAAAELAKFFRDSFIDFDLTYVIYVARAIGHKFTVADIFQAALESATRADTPELAL